MTDTETKELDNLPALTEDDLRNVGFPNGVTMAPALALFMNDRIWKRCRAVALDMSLAEGVMPTHLLNKPAACFAVISFSITWNLSPYMVARSTYQTPGGSIGFEGKLIQAILENSGKLEGGLKFQHKGDWNKVKGKFTMQSSARSDKKFPVPSWGPEDAKGLSVIVSAKVKGEVEPRTLEFELIEAFPLNSPLWATAPHRQILYTAARAFGNHALPGLLMGVPFDVDPTGFYGEPMRDITPPKPERGDTEFTRPPAAKPAKAPAPVTEVDDFSTPSNPVKKDEPSPTPAAGEETAVQTVSEAADEPQAQETIAGGGDLPNPTQEGEAPIAEEDVSQVVEEPTDAKAEFDAWHANMIAAVPKCEYVRDVSELRESVVPNLSPEHAKTFAALCDARQKAILMGTRKPAAGRKR